MVGSPTAADERDRGNGAAEGLDLAWDRSL